MSLGKVYSKNFEVVTISIMQKNHAFTQLWKENLVKLLIMWRSPTGQRLSDVKQAVWTWGQVDIFLDEVCYGSSARKVLASLSNQSQKKSISFQFQKEVSKVEKWRFTLNETVTYSF